MYSAPDGRPRIEPAPPVNRAKSMAPVAFHMAQDVGRTGTLPEACHEFNHSAEGPAGAVYAAAVDQLVDGAFDLPSGRLEAPDGMIQVFPSEKRPKIRLFRRMGDLHDSERTGSLQDRADTLQYRRHEQNDTLVAAQDLQRKRPGKDMASDHSGIRPHFFTRCSSRKLANSNSK